MKKFEEEFDKNVDVFHAIGYHNGICCSVEEAKTFGHGWVSPEEYQAEVGKIELQNLKYREEIARMQKSLRKKNKAIKELNGAVKKNKARLKECEDLRIEANNKAAMEYSRKCEVVEDRAELKCENQRLRAENLAVKTLVEDAKKQQPEIPEVPQFMDEWFKSDSLEDLIDVWYNHTSDLPENVKDYLDSLGEDITTSEYCYKEIVHLIARAKLDGYTVAKDKRFYLKHELTGQFLAKRNQESDYRKYFFWTGENPLTHSIGTAWELKFTQQEIDSMETGSYEQIPAEEEV